MEIDPGRSLDGILQQDPRAAARAFVSGDPEATRLVTSWIDRIVRNRNWRFQDPDNVVQEITLRLLQLLRADRFEGKSAFKTFVHSVTTHACIDAYRSEKRRTSRERTEEDLDTTEGSGNPEQELTDRERQRTLAYVFQQLSNDCRDMWRWVYFERRSASEVAELLGITSGAARVRVHRCLERARAIVNGMQSGIPPSAKEATA